MSHFGCLTLVQEATGSRVVNHIGREVPDVDVKPCKESHSWAWPELKHTAKTQWSKSNSTSSPRDFTTSVMPPYCSIHRFNSSNSLWVIWCRSIFPFQIENAVTTLSWPQAEMLFSWERIKWNKRSPYSIRRISTIGWETRLTFINLRNAMSAEHSIIDQCSNLHSNVVCPIVLFRNIVLRNRHPKDFSVWTPLF